MLCTDTIWKSDCLCLKIVKAVWTELSNTGLGAYNDNSHLKDMTLLSLWWTVWNLYRTQKSQILPHIEGTKFEIEDMVEVSERLWLY